MYGKKEEKSKFTGWRKALFLAAVLAAVSGCGRERTVVLETASAAGAEETGIPGPGEETGEKGSKLQASVVSDPVSALRFLH